MVLFGILKPVTEEWFCLSNNENTISVYTFVTNALVSVITAYEERTSTERITHPSAFISLRGSIDLV